MNRTFRRRLLAVLFVVATLVAGLGAPAYAGTLTSASFTASPAYTYTSSQNTRYDWGFTTATTSTLSRATMSVPPGTSGNRRYFEQTNAADNNVSTPDSAANSIAGDLDLRVDVALTNWQTGAVQMLMAKRDPNYAFSLCISGTNRIEFSWSTDGSTAVDWIDSGSTVPYAPGSAHWIRATMAVASTTIQIFDSTDGSSWNLLSSYSAGSATSIANTTDDLAIGSYSDNWGQHGAGKYYYAEVRNGINGTVVNKFDPMEATAAQAAAGSWTSSTGETWTVNRTGADRPADIATDLSVAAVSGLPSGGNANYRFIDGVATYNFTPTSIPASTPCTISLQGFINTPTAGNYASLIKTYDNTGPPPAVVDSVTTATLSFTDYSSNSNVSAVVDPSMQFTVAGRASVCNNQSATNFQTGSTATAVSLGHLSSATVGGAAQDLTINTNAANGFTVYVRTAGPTPNSLRDGAGHSIADVSGTRASSGAAPAAGTAGFGYTGDDVFASNTWAKLTNTNDSVIVGSAGTMSKTNCVGYEVAVATTTPAGTYTSTVVYTAVPAF